MSDPVVVGPITIDPEAREVSLAGQPLLLTAIEFDLLLTLARSAGRIKSREQLLLEVAERNFDVFDRSIDVHISSIRRKLGDDPKAPRFIVTIRSAGYMLKRPGVEPIA
jgi:DNA-binding response OmpR family regulator